MDSEQLYKFNQLKAILGAFEDLKEEFEPWVMEERDVSAREALENVIAHVDAKIIELHRLSEEFVRGAKA